MSTHNRWLSCGSLLLLSACSLTVANGPIPPYAREPVIADVCAGFGEVHLKDRETAITRKLEFALRQGRICFRPNVSTTGIQESWKLLGPTGLPTNDGGESSFEPALGIVAISADADELIALSDGGNFYFLRFENTSRMVPDRWRMSEGVPSTPLFMNGHVRSGRGFAVGRRNMDVMWWEDPSGNPHHWGKDGISTLYVLSADGSRIHYFDTGLPADFSHEFCGPERGQFIATAISASGSTVFLIDEAGRMYTRLVDFDVIGSNPMFFDYAFDTPRRPQDHGTDPATLFKSIRFPAEDWRLHPPIPLTARARISRRITILQTGRGNAARQLRVAGIDQEGNAGYYSKAIFDAQWGFVRTDVALADGFLLARDVRPRHAPAGDKSYAGVLRVGGESVAISFEDFNLACSPTTLLVTSNGHQVRATLHTVDVWTYRRQGAPGRDGTPKLLFASVQLPDSWSSANLSPGITRLLKRINGEVHAMVLRATENYIDISLSREADVSLGHAVEISRKNEPFEVVRDAEIDAMLRLVDDARSPALTIGDVPSEVPQLRELFQAKLRLNTLALAQLKAFADTTRDQLSTGRTIRGAFAALNVLTRFTHVARVRGVKNISKWGDPILKAREPYDRALIRRLDIQEKEATAILRGRIAALAARLRELDDP